MDTAYLHLLLNHLPVLGVPFGLLLLGAAGLARSSDLKRAALATFALAALAAVPAYLTGEPAEEKVEHIAGVSERLIHEHEERAEISLIATSVLGMLSLGALIGWRNRELPAAPLGALAVLALLTFGSLALTAKAGGEFRHTEFSGAAVSAPAVDGGGARHDDDD
ncbi:MAG: hypothetical protein AB7S38_17515 [Vulcanimicrobiota bacterium]